MGDALVHRGPDDHGLWHDTEAGVGLSFRRLAIVELSAAGRQPMHSADGRWTLIFNGEIYNHRDLRARLEQEGVRHEWAGGADTETLLACFSAWGVRNTIEQAIGMFAFALWDAVERRLVLGRDRFGEKPLYHGRQNGVFLFGSELKALRRHPAFEAKLDIEAVGRFLVEGKVPTPLSIYAGIGQLPPGCLLTLQPGGEPEIERYWSTIDLVRAGQERRFTGSFEEAVDALDRTLGEAIGSQMVADVPLGAFLSGGIDSSLVVALMQRQSATPVRTFSIGFREARYNEAEHARAVAAHLGTDHTDLYVTDRETLDVIPELPKIYDEPFADMSQIPTVLLSRMTRRDVTVSLSGDGGDEMFGGYSRYFWARNFSRAGRWLPGPLRRGAGPAMQRLVGVGNRLGRVLRPGSDEFLLGDQLAKASRFLAKDSLHEVYFALMSVSDEPALRDARFNRKVDGFAGVGAALAGLDPYEQMMAIDAVTYLPEDNLVKVDRASMSVSLESRAPFLDRDVATLAWSLPTDYKISGKVTKRVLRAILDRHVPRALIDRPKMGFGVPLEHWLRGGLRDWAEQLLDPARLERQGLLNVDEVRRVWREHQSGGRNWQYRLWAILMLQAWLDETGATA